MFQIGDTICTTKLKAIWALSEQKSSRVECAYKYLLTHPDIEVIKTDQQRAAMFERQNQKFLIEFWPGLYRNRSVNGLLPSSYSEVINKLLQLGALICALRDLNTKNDNFNDFTENAINTLAQLTELRQARFVNNYLDGEDQKFMLAEWKKDSFLELLVIPYFSQVQKPAGTFDTYYSFKNSTKAYVNDPRKVAKKAVCRAKKAKEGYKQEFPGIAVAVYNPGKTKPKLMLLDGYCRSFIFLGLGEQDDRYLVWVPKKN